MIDISIGAIGAAIIAGLVSLLGLIIGKEQKISEFRQTWIDELRKCLISYLVNINAVSDAVRLRDSGKTIDESALSANYKMLNEASHGIKFRVNLKEDTARALIKSMDEFEAIAGNNANLTPEKIRPIEQGFIESSKELLKFEWERVKRGEKIFVLTKAVSLGATAILIVAMILIVSSKGQWRHDSVMPRWGILKVYI